MMNLTNFKFDFKFVSVSCNLLYSSTQTGKGKCKTGRLSGALHANGLAEDMLIKEESRGMTS